MLDNLPQKIGWVSLGATFLFAVGFFPWDGSYLPFFVLAAGSMSLAYGSWIASRTQTSRHSWIIPWLGLIAGGVLSVLLLAFCFFALFP